MKKGNRLPKTFIIIGAVLVVIGASVFFTTRPGERQSTEKPPTAAKASGTMAMGRDDAPITVIEYSDFQCPFCAIFANDIQPELIEQYVDTGLVRFEWRNYPVFGQFSVLAAHGAMCADEQRSFWPYHDALYAQMDSLKQSDKNVDTLVAIADELELDAAAFRACIEEERYAAEIAAQYAEGRALGIVGTPTFMMNGVMMVGAQPLDTWQRVFEVLQEEL